MISHHSMLWLEQMRWELIFTYRSSTESKDNSPRWVFHCAPEVVPPPLSHESLRPPVCSAPSRGEAARPRNFPNSSLPICTCQTRARGREEARLVLMGGINQLVKLPVSNHRGASRRAGPGRGSFSPVHQRLHEDEAGGFIPRPQGPPVLPNSMRRTVSRGGVRISKHRGSDPGAPPPRRQGSATLCCRRRRRCCCCCCCCCCWFEDWLFFLFKSFYFKFLQVTHYQTNKKQQHINKNSDKERKRRTWIEYKSSSSILKLL